VLCCLVIRDRSYDARDLSLCPLSNNAINRTSNIRDPGIHARINKRVDKAVRKIKATAKLVLPSIVYALSRRHSLAYGSRYQVSRSTSRTYATRKRIRGETCSLDRISKVSQKSTGQRDVALHTCPACKSAPCHLLHGRARYSHLNKIAYKLEHARCCFRGLAYVPGRPDGSSSPWTPDSERAGYGCTDAVPVTALDTTAESHVSAIFRLTLARTVNPRRAMRRPVTSSAGRTFESGHLFRNLFARLARDTRDASTLRQVAASP